jgi:phosphoglycolate phosphatase
MHRDVLLFDLDGTLVDSAGGIAAALSQIRSERGAGPIDAETVRPWISLGAGELVARSLAEVAQEPADDLARFRAILSELPVDPDCLYPNVRETLAQLAGAGFTMAVITNKPEGLSRSLLGDLDLAKWFVTVVGGDTTPRAKPDPAPMLHALAALGASAEQAMLIGDSPVDAAAARAFAMPFLLFEGGYGAADCDDADVAARFASFDGLLALIERLNA